MLADDPPPGSLYFSQTVLSDSSLSSGLSKAHFILCIQTPAYLQSRECCSTSRRRWFTVLVPGPALSIDLRFQVPSTVHASTFITAFLRKLVLMTSNGNGSYEVLSAQSFS